MTTDLKARWDRLRDLLCKPEPGHAFSDSLLDALDAFPEPARHTATQVAIESLDKPSDWTLADLHAEHLASHLNRFSVIRPWCLAVAWVRLKDLRPHLLPIILSESPNVLCYSSNTDTSRVIEATEPVYRSLDSCLETVMLEAFEAPHLQECKLVEGPGPYGWGMRGLGQVPAGSANYETRQWLECASAGLSAVEERLDAFVWHTFERNYYYEKRDGTWGMSWYADNDVDRQRAKTATEAFAEERQRFLHHLGKAIDQKTARLFQGIHPARVIDPGEGRPPPLILERDEVIALIDAERIVMLWRHQDRWYG